MVLEQLVIHTQKVYLDTYITPFIKIKSKLIIDLNVKCKTMKLLEDDMEKTQMMLSMVRPF